MRLKKVSIWVNCRGCRASQKANFYAPEATETRFIPFKCLKCGSDNMAEIHPCDDGTQVRVQVSMVQHTKALLRMLKGKRAHA